MLFRQLFSFGFNSVLSAYSAARDGLTAGHVCEILTLV
jgi:hypothetical protein